MVKRNWESIECADNFPNYRQFSSLPYMCLTYHKYKVVCNEKNTNLKSKDCYYKDQDQWMKNKRR